MKITRTAFAAISADCVDIAAWPEPLLCGAGQGIGPDDGLITVTDEACREFCLGEGSSGLCTRKFRSDLVVDDLVIPEVGAKLRCGSAVFVMTQRQKHCHGGCELDPLQCHLNGRVLFLKVVEPGRVCVGDILREG